MEELRKAHDIILITLSHLHGEHLLQAMGDIQRAHMEGEGSTRFHERKALLERARMHSTVSPAAAEESPSPCPHSAAAGTSPNP